MFCRSELGKRAAERGVSVHWADRRSISEQPGHCGILGQNDRDEDGKLRLRYRLQKTDFLNGNLVHHINTRLKKAEKFRWTMAGRNMRFLCKDLIG